MRRLVGGRSDRLDSLATAVAMAVPDSDEQVALAVYRRLAEGSPAPAPDIAERAGARLERVRQLLASWPDVSLDAQKDVSFLTPERQFDADVIQNDCRLVHLVASPDPGETWTAEHPGTFWLTLEDAFELVRRVGGLTFPTALGDRR